MPQLNHYQCESLLNCINNGLTLKVYLDGDQNASGLLYVDDGETFNYQLPDQSALLNFNFNIDHLSASFQSGAGYVFPETQVIEALIVYGLEAAPSDV